MGQFPVSPSLVQNGGQALERPTGVLRKAPVDKRVFLGDVPLIQLGVLGFGFVKDRDAGIGVFP